MKPWKLEAETDWDVTQVEIVELKGHVSKFSNVEIVEIVELKCVKDISFSMFQKNMSKLQKPPGNWEGTGYGLGFFMSHDSTNPWDSSDWKWELGDSM